MEIDDWGWQDGVEPFMEDFAVEKQDSAEGLDFRGTHFLWVALLIGA